MRVCEGVRNKLPLAFPSIKYWHKVGVDREGRKISLSTSGRAAESDKREGRVAADVVFGR